MRYKLCGRDEQVALLLYSLVILNAGKNLRLSLFKRGDRLEWFFFRPYLRGCRFAYNL